LFARDAHVRVFVPGSSGVRAKVSMRVSRLQVSGAVTVTTNRTMPLNVEVAGPPANAQAYDTVSKLEGPPPVPLSFVAALQPGWNDVDFHFRPLAGERNDLGPGVISAAVAPDLTFTKTATLGAVTQPRIADAAFSAVAVIPPPAGLSGDPEIAGNVEGMGSHPIWLAVALADNAGTAYRLFPISQDTDAFDINFMHAFGDGWDDESKRIVGIWFISRGAHPRFPQIYYNVHGMPARALRRPQSLTNLPLRVDEREVGSRPVFLSAGKHVVTSADRQVKMTLLSVDPVSLPRSNNVGLAWHRNSPTVVSVTARSTANPFLLVFGEAYHPEWQASLNGGEPLPHVVVDGVMNGWIVPSLPNGGDITLTFSGQRYYAIAAIVSLIALIVMIALACAPQLWPIRR
jgi:hypothetical protein